MRYTAFCRLPFSSSQINTFGQSKRDLASKHTAQHRAIRSAQLALRIIKSLFTPNHRSLLSDSLEFRCISLRGRSGRRQPPAERSPCTYYDYRLGMALMSPQLPNYVNSYIQIQILYTRSSILQVPTTQLAKMSIDLKFVELTADVLEMFFYKMQILICYINYILSSGPRVLFYR